MLRLCCQFTSQCFYSFSSWGKAREKAHQNQGLYRPRGPPGWRWPISRLGLAGDIAHLWEVTWAGILPAEIDLNRQCNLIIIGACNSTNSTLPVRIATTPWLLPRVIPSPNPSDAGRFLKFPQTKTPLMSVVFSFFFFFGGFLGLPGECIYFVTSRKQYIRKVLLYMPLPFNE